MESGVGILSISPFMDINGFKSIFENNKAIVIEAYGQGNIPIENLEFVKIV